MTNSKNVSGAGSGPVDDEDKEKKPKLEKDPILAMAEFFDRLDRHRPLTPRVLTSFFTGDKNNG